MKQKSTINLVEAEYLTKNTVQISTCTLAFIRIGEVPSEKSVKKCNSGQKPHRILAINAFFKH